MLFTLLTGCLLWSQEAPPIHDGTIAQAVADVERASALHRRERYRESEQLLLGPLAVLERHTPLDHVAAVNKLAQVYQMTGQRDQELRYRLLAVKAAEAVQPADPALIVPVLGNLALHYAGNADMTSVAQMLEKARTLAADPRVVNHPVLVSLLMAHSEYHLQRGEFQMARDKAATAVRIKEQAGLTGELELMGPLHQLARAEMELGRWSVAERHWKRSLEMVRLHRGKDYPQAAGIFIPLATLARLQGHTTESETLLREAERIAELSRQPYARAVVHHELANLYVTSKRYAQAEPLFRSSLALTAGTIGTRNAEYANCLSDLAGALLELRKYAESETALREAIETAEQLRSSSDPALLPLFDRHAQLLQKLNRKAEAKQVQARVQALRASGAESGSGQTVDILGLRQSR